MLFSRDKEDDDDFVPNPNYHSNLASIFGGSSGDGNSSLTYTAPKQPKRQGKPTSSTAHGGTSSLSNSSSVIIAKTVQTFKMVDGAYQNQGKVGAAVVCISTEEGSIYQLLLYRDKRNHLCSSRITRDFNFHIQPKNYCTFYDKANIIWSIFFENAVEMADFTLQVAISKWKSEESTSPIMFQDLWCPVSDSAKSIVAGEGDSVELTYTLHTIKNSSQELGESQSVGVEVEASGWKQALVGVQPTTQRVIILQPFMLGDLNPKEVAYNAAVVVRLTVVQVNKASSAVTQAGLPKEETINVIKDLPKSQEGAPDSVTDSPKSSPKASKADLITRMARMGQALPFKKVVPNPSDSDEPEDDRQGYRLHRTQSFIPPKPRNRLQHATALPSVPPDSIGGGPSINPPVPITQQQLPIQWTAGVTPYMVSSMYPAQQLQSPVDSQFNVFFSEVRTTNSELRMGITRLTDKMEALQTKLDDSARRPDQDVTSVLERLAENEQQLKDQLQLVLSALHNSQQSNQNRLNEDPPAQPANPAAVEPCQQCMELRQANLSLTEKIQKLQEENEYLQASLTAQKDALQNAKIADKDQLSRLESLLTELENERKKVSELNQTIQNLKSDNKIVEENLHVAKISISELQGTLQEKQTSIDKLEEALRDSEATKIEEVRRNLQEVLDPKPVIGEHIKKILNAVYRLVRVQFHPQNKYDSSFVQSVIGETIKAVTEEYLLNGDVQEDEEQQLSPSSEMSLTCGLGESFMSSKQCRKEDIGVQDECVAAGADSGMSEVASTEMPLETKFPTLQQTLVASLLYAENTSLPIIKEEINVVENSNSTNQKESSSEVKAEVNTAVETADDSSDDVWRPQPPPPPLFDEEENDDDWLNS